MPKSLNLHQKLTTIKGIGQKRAEQFLRLGVRNVGTLLTFYPRAYLDLSQIQKIRTAPLGELCVVRGRVDKAVSEHFVRRGMVLYKTTVSDDSGTMEIVIFNNRYAANSLKIGEEYNFIGRISGGFIMREMSAPEIESPAPGRIRPIYPLTAGLSERMVEQSVAQVLDGINNLRDPISPELREKYSLCHIRFAYQNIHCPESFEALEIARFRLIFQELLFLQIGMRLLKNRNREKSGAVILNNFTEQFYELLPFDLTNAQQKAIAECIADLGRKIPMNRLVQGDVGSGKTAVAAALCHTVVKCGHQCAMMAPTEILAEQHFRNLAELLNPAGIRTALLTGSCSAAEKSRIREELISGEIDLIIGTHALIQDAVVFKNLGLVVTDEQHRFGVAQRAKLASKGDNPHLLVMSATPIPRTLALIIYGDLDISVLDELPPGRQKIETYAVNTAYRPRIYNFIKKHIDRGFQAYIVCPLVEEGESELTAAEEYSKKLSEGEFREYRVGLLHGKMKPAEKEAVMRSFAAGEIGLLVCTTVVEVGVDVPGAVIMVIEHADRFGLSQLHQLRGRVGRGTEKSTCILVSDADNAAARSRFTIMCETTDGFKIADEDLRQRGPGDFFGRKQHGLPELKIADMAEDMDVLRICAKCADEILNEDPDLSSIINSGILNAVEHLFNEVTAQGLN